MDHAATYGSNRQRDVRAFLGTGVRSAAKADAGRSSYVLARPVAIGSARFYDLPTGSTPRSIADEGPAPFGPAEFNAAKYSALVYIKNHPGAEFLDIANAAGVSLATAIEISDELVRQGLIRRG